MAETKRSPMDLQAHAVGTLTAMELTQTKPKEGKQPTMYLKAEISAAGSKLKVTVFGSRKNPDLPQKLNAELAVGQKVSARGSLEEQVSEDQRLFRGMRAWGISQADAHEEDKLVYHAAGHLGRLERTGAEEYVAPIICVRKYKVGDEEKEQESTLRVCPPRDQLELLYKACPVGTIVRARGDIINKVKVDRFGLPEGDYISRLDVALLEVWNAEQEVFFPLKALPQGAQLPQQPAAQPPAAPPKPTSAEPNFHDDDDVPF